MQKINDNLKKEILIFIYFIIRGWEGNCYNMVVFLYYGSIIAAICLYAKTISIIQKIFNHEDIWIDTKVGSILVGFIMFSFLYLNM